MTWRIIPKRKLLPGWDFATQWEVVFELAGLLVKQPEAVDWVVQMPEREQTTDLWFSPLTAWLRTDGLMRVTGGHTREPFYPTLLQRLWLRAAIRVWKQQRNET